MANNIPLWERIRSVYQVSAADEATAQVLLAEYRAQGYLPRTPAALARLPDAVGASFFAGLAEERSPISPAANRHDSGWMARSDFCFINVRATGAGEGRGTFIQAAKLLPGLRAQAIHLGPFTRYDHQVIYIVTSTRSLAPQVVDARLAAGGISPDEQLQAFVQAAHLLGKVVGFDLEPHMAQFAAPVLEHPELFRWIKLDPDQGYALDYGLAEAAMLSSQFQNRLVGEVRELIHHGLDAAGLLTLEDEPQDDPRKTALKAELHQALIRELIRRGYWTVLSHAWYGVGVPEYRRYNPAGYPEFRYKDHQGEEPGGKVYGALTPFAFYHDLPPNRPPEVRPQRNPAAWDYYSAIFPDWRDAFGFDFVRYDSVDHIFDSLMHSDWDQPASDRPTPAVLSMATSASKGRGHPWVGNLAERMGNEFEPYAAAGFDLILGTDMLEEPGREHLEKCFRLYDRLAAFNQDRQIPVGITYAVDTHDTGDPYLWGQPLVQKLDSRALLQRQFLGRFLDFGQAPRPKYEVVGVQDRSYGLYHANVREANLTWVGDEDHCRRYHFLEDVYAELRPLLQDGAIKARFVTDHGAWWLVSGPPGSLLAWVIYRPGEFTVPLPQHIFTCGSELARYDFWSCTRYRLDEGRVDLRINGQSPGMGLVACLPA